VIGAPGEVPRLGSAMALEMAEQPAALERLLLRAGEIAVAAREVLPAELAGIVIVARGSSDHAGIFGRYLLEIAAHRPASLAAPSLQTLYQAEVDYRGYLAVAVSQSGHTPEIAEVLGRMQAMGARGLAITNAAGNPLADTAHVALSLGVGPEEAVPATKTFTAQLMAFALVAGAFDPAAFPPEALDGIPAAAEAVLGDPIPADRVATRLAGAPGVVFVARGYLYAAALEAALKVKETSAVLAEAYSAADLRHGPIATVRPGLPVVTFRGVDPADQDVSELAGELCRQGVMVFETSSEPGAALPVPAGLPGWGLPMVAVMRAQQLARSLGLLLGRDPDRPPGLTKVTPT
jgi:glucosamine--fructose-6-phosphate aminotransferase (isomerizing)